MREGAAQLYPRGSAHIHSGMKPSIYSGIKLSELTVGRSAAVTAVDAPPALRERLRMLNVAEGCTVRLLRRAPFGGGLLLDAAGVRLALRDTLAARIEVRAIEEGGRA